MTDEEILSDARAAVQELVDDLRGSGVSITDAAAASLIEEGATALLSAVHGAIVASDPDIEDLPPLCSAEAPSDLMHLCDLPRGHASAHHRYTWEAQPDT